MIIRELIMILEEFEDQDMPVVSMKEIATDEWEPVEVGSVDLAEVEYVNSKDCVETGMCIIL